jgi:hypothetical protein
VLAELAGKSANTAKVSDANMAFGDKVAAWSRISTQGVLQAREGRGGVDLLASIPATVQGNLRRGWRGRARP